MDLHEEFQLGKYRSKVPVDIKIAKLVNKFIHIVVEARKRLDRGENIDVGNFVPESLDSSVNDSSIID